MQADQRAGFLAVHRRMSESQPISITIAKASSGCGCFSGCGTLLFVGFLLFSAPKWFLEHFWLYTVAGCILGAACLFAIAKRM